MASSCSRRKCFRCLWRVSPSTPTSIHDYHPTAVDPGVKWSGETVRVVLAVGVVLVVVLVMRLKFLRGQVVRREVTGDNGGAAGKPGQDELEKEGKWSAGPGAVDLVLMTGETKPTYLAIQCPPLMIQAKPEHQ